MRYLLVATLALGSAALHARPIAGSPRLPAFTSQQPADWFNGPPLQRRQLRGKVVLLDIWTYGCWNCYRSFPWLHQVEARFADRPFKVVGIHSPEFEHERDRQRVAAKIRAFGLTHPVMLDNDHAYWRALHNRYWPSFYLVDKRGRLRFVHIGETHAGTPQARTIEAEIVLLLGE